MPAPAAAPAAAGEREYLHLQTPGLPPADRGTPAASQRSFSDRAAGRELKVAEAELQLALAERQLGLEE